MLALCGWCYSVKISVTSIFSKFYLIWLLLKIKSWKVLLWIILCLCKLLQIIYNRSLPFQKSWWRRCHTLWSTDGNGKGKDRKGRAAITPFLENSLLKLFKESLKGCIGEDVGRHHWRWMHYACCDMIKQNESNLQILGLRCSQSKQLRFLCFLLCLKPFNSSYIVYLWNQLTNFNGVWCKR